MSAPRPLFARAHAVAIGCAAIVAAAALLLSACGPTGKSDTPPTGSATPQPSASSTAVAVVTAQPSASASTAPVADPNNVGVPLPGEDVCARNEDGSLKNPIEPGRYTGPLRTAKCEQQKFLIMARISGSLGVKCDHCHIPHPTEPKKFLYEEETENKKKARWMEATFVRGLVHSDGKPVRCNNCHLGEDNKPTAKVLKAPRDRKFAQVWMHEVMTVKFIEANGDRLRCRTCHVGMAPDVDGWIKDVIRHVELTPDGLARK